MLFEGEEESGSPSLKPFLESNAKELEADVALICDTGMLDRETPAITAALRGLVGEEVTIHAADRDLHSGEFGGAAANPIHILAKILADLHDEAGRVTIPGFYDGVEETPPEVLKMWEDLAENAGGLLRSVGLSVPAGERGRSILEMVWARPTAEVNGIAGGYAGKGFKTVLPAEAMAKVSFRLVHEQNPASIRSAFRDFVRARVPTDCTVSFKEHGGAPATQISYDSPIVKKAKAALGEEWGKPAVIIAAGGSIPVAGEFRALLGMDSLLVGFGLPDAASNATRSTSCLLPHRPAKLGAHPGRARRLNAAPSGLREPDLEKRRRQEHDGAGQDRQKKPAPLAEAVDHHRIDERGGSRHQEAGRHQPPDEGAVGSRIEKDERQSSRVMSKARCRRHRRRRRRRRHSGTALNRRDEGQRHSTAAKRLSVRG
jgi:hypothetical protein